MTGCDRQAQQAAPPPVPEVATIAVAPRPLLLMTELPGRTSPYRVAEIRPQVSGLVQKRLFTEGSDVQAGQELYQIDQAPFLAALSNAKAALGRATASLPALQARATRAKDALTDKAVSQQDVDDAVSAVKQVEAEILFYEAGAETARINLGYTRIVSPITGRIGKSTVTDGAIVTAFQPQALATVQQLDPIYVDVPQSAAELLRLRRRLAAEVAASGVTNTVETVRLTLEDGTAYPLEGVLQFRDVSVDPTTASVSLRMLFPNPRGLLLPGMFVRTLVKEGVNEHAILIPQQAVSRNPKGTPLVLVLDAAGNVEQREITLDRAIGDQWLVSAGLVPGDRVIVEGMQKIRPGTAVREVPFDSHGKPRSTHSADKPEPTTTAN
jgi:membrane fusion protein (multidrug efflux system)